MGLGVSLAFVPIIGVLFNLAGIPLAWYFFLPLLVIPIGCVVKTRKLLVPNSKYVIYGLLLIMFGITAYMYVEGSFSTPYFEDADPWEYAYSSFYISEHQTYSAKEYLGHFLEPYPQGYSIVMGMLMQTNNKSIYWNMKFFHNLLISLSILFFFFFANKLFNNEYIALATTFCLFSIPCWLSRFIFSLGFNMTLMLVFFWCLTVQEKYKKTLLVSVLVFASIWVTHFYTAVIISILFLIYYFLKVLVEGKFREDLFLTGLFGFLLAVFGFYIPSLYKHRAVAFSGEQLGGLYLFLKPNVLFWLGQGIAFLVLLYFAREYWFPPLIKKVKPIKHWVYAGILIAVGLVLLYPKQLFYVAGSGSRAYNLADFFIARRYNMINNPIGVGIMLSILLLVGIWLIASNSKKLFEKDKFHLLLSLTWFVFCFLGVMGARLSIGFVPFRLWTFLAIPISLIAGWALWKVIYATPIKNKKLTKVFKTSPQLAILIILCLVGLIVYTSFIPKYQFNTDLWPEHKIMDAQSRELFEWAGGYVPEWRNETCPAYGNYSLRVRTKALCHPPFVVFAYGMYDPGWLSIEMTNYYNVWLDDSLEYNYLFLKANRYEYAIVDAGGCVLKFKQDPQKLNEKVNEMVADERFEVIFSTQSAILFEVN